MDLMVWETSDYTIAATGVVEQPILVSRYVKALRVHNQSGNSLLRVGTQTLTPTTGRQLQANEEFEIEAPKQNSNQGVFDLANLQVVGTIGDVITLSYSEHHG